MEYRSSTIIGDLIPVKFVLPLLLAMVCFTGCKDKPTEQEPDPDVFQLQKVSANEVTLSADNTTEDISVDAQFEIQFSSSVDTETIPNNVTVADPAQDTAVALSFSFEDNNRRILVDTKHGLDWNNEYELDITNKLQSAQGAEFQGASYTFKTQNGQIEILSASLNSVDILSTSDLRGISYDDISLELTFSEALSTQGYQSYFNVQPSFSTNYSISNDGKTVTLTNAEVLDYYRHYYVGISNDLTAANGFEFDGYEINFQTGLDSTQKLPQLTESQLLDKVQKETFDYFWNTQQCCAHPTSGLAQERNTSGDLVTIGGSGFGLMTIIVGIERGFITQQEGIDRFKKIVEFLGNADRFHGVWPHWMNGSTGSVIPFSSKDDGGDLVETSYMAQGLITVREYLNANTTETQLITDINALLDTIEWDWYTQNNQNVLYWHWSPNYGWEMNMQVKGYNEALITYVMAASSTTHSINADVYHEGWASSGSIQNGNTFYGYQLPVGYDYGGPLFFAHYSFLGLEPQGLSDMYADYWKQNQNHTLINYEHSVRNPNGFVGYSADSWGLTASDEEGGYGVHEPTNDNGTLTPTAALSSMPYTPVKSKRAMRHFYYLLGDKLWGEYGFYDAFNPTQGWWADSYLAIDQGPIIVMIENHRSGLLWDLFMSAPEVQNGLNQLGFTVQ